LRSTIRYIIFFCNWILAVIVLTYHPPWREDVFVSYEYAWLSSSEGIAHIAHYWKLFALHYSQVLCQSRLCKADHVCVLLILCYNGSIVTWTVVSLTTAKFKPLTFSTSDFALSYTAKMFVLMILYYLCLFSVQFCYIIVYIRNVENRMQIADRCTLCRVSNVAENADL
jgi:hypothetical protein